GAQDASVGPSGTSAPHGAVASIRKKSAALRRTVRSTSESASVATESPRSGRRGKESGRPVRDAAAAQSYARREWRKEARHEHRRAWTGDEERGRGVRRVL